MILLAPTRRVLGDYGPSGASGEPALVPSGEKSRRRRPIVFVFGSGAALGALLAPPRGPALIWAVREPLAELFRGFEGL